MNKKTYCAPLMSVMQMTIVDVLSASIEDSNSFVKDSYDWLGGGI